MGRNLKLCVAVPLIFILLNLLIPGEAQNETEATEFKVGPNGFPDRFNPDKESVAPQQNDPTEINPEKETTVQQNEPTEFKVGSHGLPEGFNPENETTVQQNEPTEFKVGSHGLPEGFNPDNVPVV
ncbi:uncharacterized protein LOC134707698 [Mytilus trossulus]|uniref:uncharacterized protein LOC134707698 n=1 Tax=Mytilus trossulus TaxID=6551 RepID=UPI003006FBB8